MDKEKIIIRLNTQVDTLGAHIKRLKKEGYKIHSLDIDMLRQKTLEFYELVFELEKLVDESSHSTKQNDDPAEKNTNKELQEEVKVIIEESAEEKIPTASPEVTKEEVEEPIISEPVPPTPPVMEPKITDPAPTIEEEIKDHANAKMEEPEKSENPVQQTAYELFTGNTDSHVAEKFQIKEEQSIAEKIQKSHISNIREAIGINEKFLFINELFNGDLGRYNKILDDINELPTEKGLETYLFELKIEFQWADDNEAYIKLKDLLDRKFS